jgi:hypothetical protein
VELFPRRRVTIVNRPAPKFATYCQEIIVNTPKRLDEHTWSTFVRPAVKFKDEPNTRKLLEEIMPYFPKACVCIGGYLDDDDQFWKVNYHWELLTTMLRKAIALGVRASEAQLLLKPMLENPPNPATGYTVSQSFSEPHDSSSCAQIRRRWSAMNKVKRAFAEIVKKEGLAAKYPPSEFWTIAVAHIMPPARSKHGNGYAVDIWGHNLNKQIVEIATGLGATMTYDESSHVHVEFKQGVVFDGQLVADNPYNGKYMGWAHRRHADCRSVAP